MTFSVYGLPLLGGVLIGLAASLLLLSRGRAAGISGIFGETLAGKATGREHRAPFLVGLAAAGVLLRIFAKDSIGGAVAGPGLLVAAGLLVGYGTRLGGGCTSGHGVCGISRLSLRSFVATGTFMATAAVTVLVLRHVLGGAS